LSDGVEAGAVEGGGEIRGIFENSVAGIFSTSAEGAYLDINPALIRI